MVYGRSRLVNTKATTFAVNYLPELLYIPIPVSVAESKSYKVPSTEKFYRDILNDFEFSFEGKKDELTLRNLIVNLLHESAEHAPVRRVVVIMDEGQKPTEWQYDCLIDIYNQLMRRNVRMITITIGQEQLVTRGILLSFLCFLRISFLGNFESAASSAGEFLAAS